MERGVRLPYPALFVLVHKLKVKQKIYQILTNRKFRTGPLPDEDTKKSIIQVINSKVSKNLPIGLLQFWGGCKNPNLPYSSAGLCEELTLDNLKRIDTEVKKIYKPGLKIYISLGDKRVEEVNLIPEQKTEKYVNSLFGIAKKEKYGRLFTVVPVSTLYQKSKNFRQKLDEVERRIKKDLDEVENIEKLIKNARKNIFTDDLTSEREIRKRVFNSAKNYIIYRVAEEEAQIFIEFKDCIRSSFIRYKRFYQKYIKDIDQTKPNLNCYLNFFTSKKGNITQPWQAIAEKNKKEIIFLSQERIKNIKPRL